MMRLRPRSRRIVSPVALKLFPFLAWRSRVTAWTLRKDAIAGLVGALVVLPQGVAYATLAGLPPPFGLYCAMVPVVVAALWGSSWHQISGPTNALSLVVFATIAPLALPQSGEYITLVLTLTFIVGARPAGDGRRTARRARGFHLAHRHRRLHRRRGLADHRGAAQELLRREGSRRRQLFRDPARVLPQPRDHRSVDHRHRGRHARRRGRRQADDAARSVHDRRDGGRRRIRLRARARGIRHRADRGRASVRLADAVVAFLRSRSVAQAHSGGARIDGAGADRSGIDRARDRGANRTAHRRQSGVHRPGPVEHRRRVLVGLPLLRIVQPQRRQLRGRRPERRSPPCSPRSSWLRSCSPSRRWPPTCRWPPWRRSCSSSRGASSTSRRCAASRAPAAAILSCSPSRSSRRSTIAARVRDLRRRAGVAPGLSQPDHASAPHARRAGSAHAAAPVHAAERGVGAVSAARHPAHRRFAVFGAVEHVRDEIEAARRQRPGPRGAARRQRREFHRRRRLRIPGPGRPLPARHRRHAVSVQPEAGRARGARARRLPRGARARSHLADQGGSDSGDLPAARPAVCAACTVRIFTECNVALPDGTPRTAVVAAPAHS